MYNVKHNSCGKIVSKDLKQITNGYELFCPECDEDLLPSECTILAPDEEVSLVDAININSAMGLTILQDYGSKSFMGCRERVVSTVTYDNPVDVAIYHWDKFK